ncbi:MAG: radical SAM protein, partial [Nanoarchaeota archaeon]|nr:radical SAM protein [Nanoarchaeota archaeon]
MTGKKFIADIDVSDNCNLRCRHCYHFHGKDVFEKKEIPIETWEQRFRELHSSGIRLLLMVGGEPALRKDVLMLANNIFPVVSVITNGTIKIPKEFDNRLIVSIDGSQKTNDSIRGEGTFARVLENYSGDKRVVINMVLMKDNYKELGEVVEIARKHGFKGVVCNINTRGVALKNPKLVNERRNIINELKRVKSLYPKELLLSRSMIKWYEQPDHSDSC